jgi:hypothetical protein
MDYLNGKIFRVILGITFGISTLIGQPYYYYSKSADNRIKSEIYQVNLMNGQNRLFLSNLDPVTYLSWNQDQSWLYMSTKAYFQIIETTSLQKHILIDDEHFQGISGALLIPQINRLFVTWLKSEEDGSTSHTYVFEPSTFECIDSLEYGNLDNRSILIEDRTKYYQWGPNEEGNSIISYISINPNFLVSEKPLLEVGPKTSMKILLNGMKGKGLFQYGTEPTLLAQRYCTVNILNNIIESDFPFPLRSEGQFSPDGKCVVIEEVNFEKSPTESQDYRPGNIYIFNSTNGQLQQKLQLLPEGKILLFDNYPDQLYYLTGTEGLFQVAKVPLNVVTPTKVLLDSLYSLTNQTYKQNLIGDANFVKELSNDLQNGLKHLIKEDSLNCSKEISVFQDKIKKEYDKKNISKDKRFVTEDGYKYLYFSAQYTIDRLQTKK